MTNMAEEKEIGKITHYFDKISVGVINLSSSLKVGQLILVKGAAEDFEQEVESMQLDHKDIKTAKKGDLVAIKVKKPVRKNDSILTVK